MDWKAFLKAAGIRALRTVAQAALAMIPAGIMITEVNWLTVLYTAALAGVCSLLTSLATGLPEVEKKPPNTEDADLSNISYEKFEQLKAALEAQGLTLTNTDGNITILADKETDE